MEFIKDFAVENLIVADYNPRIINENSYRKLKESITKFGIIKPLIINGDNNILTAGHQRTKTLKELGINFTPVIKLQNIAKSDEIMFNLFHNSIETNGSKVGLSLVSNIPYGYSFVKPGFINIRKNLNPIIVKEISKLIIKYGTWGSAICDETGAVVVNSEYAIACKLLEKPLLVYKMKNDEIEELRHYLKEDYGKYYFNNLEVKDYNQTFCQMHRLKGEKELKSTTYTKYVLPILNKNMRVLDFGAGKCSYPNKLRKEGYNIFMYEPFYRKEKSNAFDINQIVSFLEEIQRDISKNGLYDIVILDSVLNSITNLEMQHNVLLVCNSLLKDNGTLILGTRSLGKTIATMKSKQATNRKRDIEFLDDNQLTLIHLSDTKRHLSI
ncbi:MAG: methyltransferase domain-containing protein [Candidatus Gastranaerophilales bacterium]|nr:methyltransferase domain-containing protein [Candidatus Gastranaerophilales bacterium]